MFLVIGDYKLSVTPIKYKSVIYWATTPHGIFIESGKKYLLNYNERDYECELHKQSYWCDLALFVCDIKIKMKKTKVLKAHNYLKDLTIKNEKIKGFVSEFCYQTHLDINGACRNLFYKIDITDGKVCEGDSGSGLYKKDRLVGLISHLGREENTCFCVPVYFVLKVLEKESDFISFLPLKLTMVKKEVIVIEKYNDVEAGYKIKKIDNLNVENGMVYVGELKDYIPLDTYVHIYGEKDGIIKISDKKSEYKLRVMDMNSYLKYPFVSGVSEKPDSKHIYQDLWEKRFEEDNLESINSNLVY